MFSNPYGWTTSPVQLPGRTRKAGLWVSAWVDFGRPVILDTSAIPLSGFDARRRVAINVDDDWKRRYSGSDEFPDDALLVIMHPKLYMNLKMRTDLMSRTGPDVAASIIDDVCRLHPELEERMRWKVLGVSTDDDAT